MTTPTWKSAPDVAGMWELWNGRRSVSILRVYERDLPAFDATPVINKRYYGPIPEDKNEH